MPVTGGAETITYVLVDGQRLLSSAGSFPMADSPLHQETIDFASSSRSGSGHVTVGLTLLQHPDVSRVGQVAVLFESVVGGSRRLSRAEPEFRWHADARGTPLLSGVISRTPLVIQTTGETSFSIGHDGSLNRVRVDGQPLTGSREFEVQALQRGIVIELAGCVLLLLHLLRDEPEQHSDLNLFGESVEIRRVRDEIRRVADLSTSILIRGESGSGKELVARAIHRQSRRSAGPYVSVNMGAIPATVAASMLFGHARGAFTGAAGASPGFFGSAHGGTLFLDEVGETPSELQPLLLRAIREGKIQPVGEANTRKVDVRVISATDADLEALLERGRFSLPLLRRLEGYTIAVPPLRERRDDLARLFFRFLRRELEATEEANKLDEPPPDRKPWLPTTVLSSMLEYGWPGNVAELETIAKRIAITNRDRRHFVLDALIAARLRVPVPDAPSAGRTRTADAASAQRRDTTTLSDDEIAQAMRLHQFKVGAAALALGVSRSWLNTRLESCNGIRKAKDLGREEILAAAHACAWDLVKMAERLEVSGHGLKLRINALESLPGAPQGQGRAPNGPAG
jgi:two-component system, NtrC family, nitrogen regulation response regulator GlnG